MQIELQEAYTQKLHFSGIPDLFKILYKRMSQGVIMLQYRRP